MENCVRDLEYLLPVDMVYWAWFTYSVNIASMRVKTDHLALYSRISGTWVSCTGKGVSILPYNLS